jgi:hypothetical protein
MLQPARQRPACSIGKKMERCSFTQGQGGKPRLAGVYYYADVLFVFDEEVTSGHPILLEHLRQIPLRQAESRKFRQSVEPVSTTMISSTRSATESRHGPFRQALSFYNCPEA